MPDLANPLCGKGLRVHIVNDNHSIHLERYGGKYGKE